MLFKIMKRPLTLVLAALAAAVPAGVAFASSSEPVSRVTALVGQENTNPETNLDFLFAIYLVTWVGFFAYIFIVSRRQRTMEREIEALKNVLAAQQQRTEKG